jgi:uncharacterized membrane protein
VVLSNRQLAGDASSEDRLFALLSYLIGIIVPIIVLVTDRKNRPFNRLHAINSLGLSIVWIVWVVIYCVLSLCIGFVLQNSLGGILGTLLSCVFGLSVLGYLALIIYYMIMAYQGNYFDIPVITNFARQQRWI